MRARLRLWRPQAPKHWNENRERAPPKGSLALRAPSTSRFDTNEIVNGSIDSLLAAKVSLSCLN